MNAIEQPRNEKPGSNPPPPAFDDAVYAEIFNSAPKPTAEELEKSRKAREQLEQSFDWRDSTVVEMSAGKAVNQEARVARLAHDAEAAKKLSEEIRKAA